MSGDVQSCGYIPMDEVLLMDGGRSAKARYGYPPGYPAGDALGII